MLTAQEIQEAHSKGLYVRVPAINLLNVDTVGYLILAYLFLIECDN